MKKLDLHKAAEEFETIDGETEHFYNTETGEFDFYINQMISGLENDPERFEDDVWIRCPSQRDIGEYDAMCDFAGTVTDRRAKELLGIALEGKGAFRRFKDTLHRVGLTDEWHAFKHNAFLRLAKAWCEKNEIEYFGDAVSPDEPPPKRTRPEKMAVTLATLESLLHEVNAIKTGAKLYNGGKAEVCYDDNIGYIADVADKTNPRRCSFHFTRDGQELEEFFCSCGAARDGALCKHVVAGVLAAQGGIPETNLVLGKTAGVSITVGESNTAIAMQSGSLPVFATPSMVALMEKAACECLVDCLDEGQTSVGTKINVEHTSASPMGTEITATATIEYVFGRRIEFKVTAADGVCEVGKGKHTRMIVDAERFMKKAEAQK